MENVEGKVVVITGASAGLGAETARHLVNAGARVALGARRKNELDELVSELGEEHALAVEVDVTDAQQVQQFVDQAAEQFGQIDVMLHNAGIMPLSPLAMNRVEEWDDCIDVNLKGVLYGIGAVLPHMKENKRGQNILVSSVAGHVANETSAVFSATKAGVRSIAESLRQEVKEYHLRTTVLSPGALDTELPESVNVDEVAKAMEKFYDQQAISPANFARAVVYAISQPDEVDVNELLFRPTSQKM